MVVTVVGVGIKARCVFIHAALVALQKSKAVGIEVHRIIVEFQRTRLPQCFASLAEMVQLNLVKGNCQKIDQGSGSIAFRTHENWAQPQVLQV